MELLNQCKEYLNKLGFSEMQDIGVNGVFVYPQNRAYGTYQVNLMEVVCDDSKWLKGLDWAHAIKKGDIIVSVECQPINSEDFREYVKEMVVRELAQLKFLVENTMQWRRIHLDDIIPKVEQQKTELATD